MPLLGVATADAASALAISASYVALLYLPPFHARGLPRDHPATIARRFAACAVSCLLAVVLFFLAARSADDAPRRLLGLSPPRPWRAFFAPPLLALVPYLPTGCAWLVARRREACEQRQNQQSPPSRRRATRRGRSLLVLLRDCLVAPLTEELAFRACLLPLLVPLVGVRLAPWIAPLFFSLAHAHHHLVPSALSAAAKAKKNAPSSSSSLAPLLLQLSYTYAFGLYASLMLVATGSLPGVVVAHALCNALGLPGGGGGGRVLLAATAAATGAMVAALAAPTGALDAARWYGGGLFGQ
jgi:prenyl protein peptidase